MGCLFASTGSSISTLSATNVPRPMSSAKTETFAPSIFPLTIGAEKDVGLSKLHDVEKMLYTGQGSKLSFTSQCQLWREVSRPTHGLLTVYSRLTQGFLGQGTEECVHKEREMQNLACSGSGISDASVL